MMISLVRNVKRYSLSHLSDIVLSSAIPNALSHVVIKLDRHLGEVKRQLTKLKELDMKNYFVLGRCKQKKFLPKYSFILLANIL